MSEITNEKDFIEGEIITDQNIGKMPQNYAKHNKDNAEPMNEFFAEMVGPEQPNKKAIDETVTEDSVSSFDDFNDFSDNTDAGIISVEVYQEVESGEGDVLYSTGDLAKMFEVSNQTIRNTADFFVEILSDERGANGQKLYTYEDVAIIKKIFYMSGVQKYKRRQIRDILIGNGITAKTGSTFATNVNLEGLRRKDESTPISTPAAPANMEVFQNKLSDAMGVLQTRVFEKLNEGFSQLEANISKAFIEDLHANNEVISSELTKTKEELIETIKSQANIIEEQRKEIIKLKGTIININHTALEIDKGVKALGNDTVTKNDIEKLTENIGTVIKESSAAPNISEDVKNEINKITTASQNTAKQITEEFEKQGKAIENIQETVSKIDSNATNNSQAVKKSDMADVLNRNYQKIEKALQETKANQENLIGEKMDELAELLKNSLSQGQPIDDALVDDLNEKLRSALESLTKLQREKDDLNGKNQISRKIIDKQTATIEELKEKLAQASEGQADSDGAFSHKLEIARKLIDKLSAEKEDLESALEKSRKNEKIQAMIIQKQDQDLESYRNAYEEEEQGEYEDFE